MALEVGEIKCEIQDKTNQTNKNKDHSDEDENGVPAKRKKLPQNTIHSDDEINTVCIYLLCLMKHTVFCRLLE